MHKSLIATALAATLLPQAALAADGVEQRLRYLEQRLAAQDKAILNRDADRWWRAVTLSGAVEAELGLNDDDSSDIVAATAELVISAAVTEWAHAELVLLYEEDDTPLDVDAATLHLGRDDAPVGLTVGRTALPFGRYETLMVGDPLTLELGETFESIVALDFNQGPVSGALYLFNGDTDKAGADDAVDNGGLSLAYAHEAEWGALELGLDYLSDLGDGDLIGDAISSGAGNSQADVAGSALHAVVSVGDATFIAEYLSAMDTFDVAEVAFNGEGAQPSALNVELGYAIGLGGYPATVAIGVQQSAEAVALGLPETRTRVGLALDLADGVGLAFEWAQDTDYAVSDGGTGDTSSSLTAQLAMSF